MGWVSLRGDNRGGMHVPVLMPVKRGGKALVKQ